MQKFFGALFAMMVVASFTLIGFVSALGSVERRDLGGYKKAAYEEGLKKGLADGHELGQGEPKLADGGVEYTAVYCEPDYPPDRRSQVCLARRNFAGLPEFIKVPEVVPAIKPGQKFRVSYSSGGYVYLTE